MKKTRILLAAAAFSLFSFHFSVSQAQDNPVIIEVAGKQIRQSEFMEEFNANVGRQLANKEGVTLAEKQAALEEYAELYAIFRAKEHAARLMGLDTTDQLRRELKHYRKDLAAPYLIDSAMLKHLLAEAYERNQISLRAAHILAPVRLTDTPDDTLKAYRHILELRQRIVNGGEDFFAVASEEMARLNPQAPQRPNEGDLGYFTVFDMIYPFENAAYALQVGEVSQPIRTQYGYHIIKLLDRVEGLYGEVTMAHIWLNSPDSAKRADEINSIYAKLQEGTPFEKLTFHSDDRTTATKGGVLADASLSQLPPEYIHMIAGMKEGEFSKPFFTQYGWHIVKLIKRYTLPPAETLEGVYKQRMSRDMRGEESRMSFIENCQKKYGIIDCTKTPMPQPKAQKGKKKAPITMMASLDYLTNMVNDTLFRIARWHFKDSDFTDTTPLVITPDRRYTALDVAHYIRRHQRNGIWEARDSYVRNSYREFFDSVVIAYADSQLEKEYPEFAQIVEEYRRGLMIFNYNDKMVWHKAVQDTAGFADFYAHESRTKRLDNPDDSLFFFHPRARVTVIAVADSNALAPEKALKLITKAQKKSLGSNEMKQLLLKKIDRKRFSSDDLVTADVELVEQTRQRLLTDEQWQKGTYLQRDAQGYRILVVDELIPRTLKDINEARGYYLSAWQNEVERRLNEELRTKYNVKIHRDVVHSIAF